MAIMWRARWLGAVLPVSLKIAPARGGTMTAASARHSPQIIAVRYTYLAQFRHIDIVWIRCYLAGAMGESGQSVEFGRYRLLPAQRLLVEGEVPVPLGGRAFDILMVLVERHREVVSKDELMRRVWGGQVVEENTLAVHLSALRKALGDGKQGIRYIGTVAGRGYQFVAPVEAVREAETAPPKAASSGNLPQALALLIGRELALAQVVSAIGSARLVTLTGPGGIGKTRLALALGEHLASDYADGVWWVDLTAVGDPALVAGSVARALGIQLGDAPPLPRLVAGLKGLRRLLILDNCEHVIAGVAELAVALWEVVGVRLLATSLEPLGVTDEQVERLGSLAVPGAAVTTVAEAMGVPAVQLFVARARAAAQSFVLDEDNVGAVVRLCRQLEGVPLALELAAARAAVLGAEAVAQRLDGRLLELSSGRRDVLPKHQTLRALLEWSHGLLSVSEKIVLRRLTVFVGGCTLDAAEAVVVVADGTVAEWRVPEYVASLIAKSLVIAERTAQGARYRMLETTRIFAMEQLEASGESAATAERHARYFTELFEQAYIAWETTPEMVWHRLYAPELDNVRTALNWALLDPGRSQIAVALAGPSGMLWAGLGLQAEGGRYLDRAIERIDTDTPLAPAARLLNWAAVLLQYTDHPRAVALGERSAALYRQLGDRLGLAKVSLMIGNGYVRLGRNAEAKALFDEAYETLSASDHKKSLCALMNALGTLAAFTNNNMEARDHYIRALELARELKRLAIENMILSNLAEIEYRLGSVERAVELTREAIHGFRRLGRRDFLSVGLNNLTQYLIFQGNPSDARLVAREAFILARENGGVILRTSFEPLALLGALEGRHRQAAVLLGFTTARFANSGEIREPTDQQIHDRLVQVLNAELPAADIQTLMAEGAQWSETQAADLAFDEFVSPRD